MKIPVLDSIFRDYDIRGIYPTQINEKLFYTLGCAIVAYLKPQVIGIGYDARLSSPSLFNSLVRGITDCGTNVVDLGMISTEMHNFASGKYGFDANIIVSASHNPGEYNGLKIVRKGVIPLHGKLGLPEIKKYVIRQKFPSSAKKGNISKKDIKYDWSSYLLTQVNVSKFKPLKVAIDAGNGMGGLTWSLLSKKLPITIIPLYFEPNGHFPNHLPDPLKEKNIKDLQVLIKQEKADLGFALDGDADRLFVLTNTSEVLSGTITTALLVDHLLSKKGKETILYNAVVGKIVPEIAHKKGAKAIRVRVGHSFIKEAMKKYQAIFAGEHSGHYYFRNLYYADSSTLAGLYILELLSSNKKSLSSLVKVYDKYPQSKELNYKVNDSEKVINKIKNKFMDAKIDQLDGLSARYPKWWFNLRASKTEPLLRLNVEGNSRDLLQSKVKKIEDVIIECGGIIV